MSVIFPKNVLMFLELLHVLPNLFIPTTTLNHYMTAIASPNGASLNVQTLTNNDFVMTHYVG